MNPLMAHLIIALLSGTNNWTEVQYITFFNEIELSVCKEEITLADIELVVASFNKEMPSVQGD
jgi:hypothetical protein